MCLCSVQYTEVLVSVLIVLGTTAMQLTDNTNKGYLAPNGRLLFMDNYFLNSENLTNLHSWSWEKENKDP